MFRRIWEKENLCGGGEYIDNFKLSCVGCLWLFLRVDIVICLFLFFVNCDFGERYFWYYK